MGEYESVVLMDSSFFVCLFVFFLVQWEAGLSVENDTERRGVDGLRKKGMY